MTEVRLEFPAGNGQADQADIDALRADLDAHVGATSYAEGEAREGEKGGPIEIATLVISLLGTPAAVALVGVLKSYFDREKVTELKVTTDKGTVEIKVPAGKALGDADIRRALDSVIGPA